MKKVLNWLLTAIALLAFGLGGAIFLIEWMAGCGETYIAADGKRYANECVFIK